LRCCWRGAECQLRHCLLQHFAGLHCRAAAARAESVCVPSTLLTSALQVQTEDYYRICRRLCICYA
jgi:hypothetical protein